MTVWRTGVPRLPLAGCDLNLLWRQRAKLNPFDSSQMPCRVERRSSQELGSHRNGPGNPTEIEVSDLLPELAMVRRSSSPDAR